MKRFVIDLPGVGETSVEFVRKGAGARVKIGSETFDFTAEQLAESSVEGLLAEGSLLIWSAESQRTLDCKVAAASAAAGAGMGQRQLKSLFPGKVVKVLAKEKVWVEEGELLLVMESMKMEYQYQAPQRLFIEKILVREGEILAKGREFFASHA